MRNLKRRVTDLAERIKSAILFPFIIVLLVVMAISGYYDKDDYDWGVSMMTILVRIIKKILKILLTPLFKLDEMIDPGFNPYDRRGRKEK